jgi:hypothetical protein
VIASSVAQCLASCLVVPTGPLVSILGGLFQFVMPNSTVADRVIDG